jgi:protein-S-isoprenylcysteine O-methyltransferase Ste14
MIFCEELLKSSYTGYNYTMEKETKKEEILNINQYKNKIHVVLAQSYSIYFLFFVVGVFLDLVFNLKMFKLPFLTSIGAILIFLASLLIFWAQKTSRNLKKENLTKESFSKGPYFFVRNPTYLGLFLLLIGFGFMVNAIFIIITTIISGIFTKFIYLKKEEVILEKKYGAPYIEYKKAVKF